ncbi:MAG TPA: translocation/assembly module TamB domain-containing protein [Dissulfurispiraceae bacterium]|nr:translocation/assembly module TamB domain-containing protein [Dissulfurispiraceae bacterium]
MTIPNKKKLLYYAVLAVFLALIFYILRGPNISNELKKLILPELEAATGKKFVAQKIYINLIPFFIEIKELKAFDEDGTRVLTAERVKGYISLSGFLDKQIVIKRLSIQKAQVYADDLQVETTVKHITAYLQQESKFPFKLVIQSVLIDNAEFQHQSGGAEFAATGLHADILLGKTPRFRITADKLSARLQNFASFQSSLETIFTLKDNALDIKKIRLLSGKSDIAAEGFFDTQKKTAALSTEISLALDTIKHAFGLKQPGDGLLNVSGKAALREGTTLPDRIVLDLNVRGDFFLESLMELLKVKEKLRGWLHAEGTVTGPLSDLRGSGLAELKKGNLFDVEAETVKCGVSYARGEMHFTKGVAELYGGTATAEATIALPVVHTFRLKVQAHDVDSSGVFQLIRWDPGIAPGKVSGELATSGRLFQPDGKFEFRSVQEGPDILGRVRAVSGIFSMRGQTISFPEMQISTAESRTSTAGSVDLKQKKIEFTAHGTTLNLRDFFAPYFTSLSGPASFETTLSGDLEDPVLAVRFSGQNDTFVTTGPEIPDFLHTIAFPIDQFSGSLRYQKNVLTLHELSTKRGNETLKAFGTVVFRKAKHLFDIRNPDYALTVSGKNLAMSNVAGVFRHVPAFGGTMDTRFTVSGLPHTLRLNGNLSASRFSFDPYFSVAEGEAAFVYEKNRFSLSAVHLKNGSSDVRGRGSVSFDGTYAFSASGSQLNLIELLPPSQRAALRNKNLKTVMLSSVDASGSGSFDKPSIVLKGSLFTTAMRGQSLGRGTFSATLQDKSLAVSAKLIDNRALLEGKVSLADPYPWRAALDLNSARADFLLTSFFRGAPDDLIINLKGRLTAAGTKNSMDGTLSLDKTLLYAYGMSLVNTAPVHATLKDRHLVVSPMTLRGDLAEFKAHGTALLGEHLDLYAEGTSSLGPLRFILRELDTAKGNSSFVVSVSGAWDSPKISGGIEMQNATFGMAGIPHRITDVSGYAYFDEDKIVLKNATGKLSGGQVAASGSATLRGFGMDRFFVETRLAGATFSSPQRLVVNLDSDLIYQGTLEKQHITGDVRIRRASYTERIDLISLLLKTKPRDVPNRELTALERALLNIKLSGENLYVDNNMARATLLVDAYLRGTVSQPVLLGRVQALQGIAFFRGNEFRIQRANLDFADPVKNRPYFSVLASSRVSNYQVRLHLDGYLDQFSLALSSDPSLSENDIFSLLAFGQTGQGGKETSDTLGAGGATSFLSGQLQSTLEERIRTVTGIDRIVVEPAISKITGTMTARVSAQKRLLDDKLVVTYSAAAGTGEEQVWKLEYLLGKNTSLVGQRDEKGGIGGDIKFRFEFK